MKKSLNKNSSTLQGVALAMVAALFVFNQWQIGQLHSIMGGNMNMDMKTSESKIKKKAGGLLSIKEVQASVIPTGVPEMPYGQELGVNFDQAQASINILESYDRGANKITLTGDKLQRYIKIGQSTSCEYCCSARTMVNKNGSPACGCAHSAAMRGLAAYLLENNSDQYSDDQILDEVNRWKAVFFPKQTIQKAVKLQAETGGIDASALNEMPAMVGGC